MAKNETMATVLAVLLGLTGLWGYSEHQKIQRYEEHVSQEYVDDYAQLAGYLNSSKGYLSVVMKNGNMHKEEQDSLVNGIYEVAHVMQKYDEFAYHMNRVDQENESEHTIRTAMAVASYIANLNTADELSGKDMEKIKVAYELLDKWNSVVLDNIPELNAEEETYAIFFEKYQEEGIKGSEWISVLDGFNKETTKISKAKNISLLPEYFYR